MWRKIKKNLARAFILLLILPVVIIITLRWVNPSHSAFILRHNFIEFSSGSKNYAVHPWTDLEKISPEMAIATIAAEDQRFPTHFGIDFTELFNALTSRSSKSRGASTITQQTAKNLFLWPGRSYVRKIFEAGLAVVMELFLPKSRILEIYLNIAQTGPSFFGVTAASQIYFGKDPSKLNRYEAARISAVLPNPNEFSITNPSSYVIKRQKWIIKQAKQLGGLSILKSLD